MERSGSFARKCHDATADEQRPMIRKDGIVACRAAVANALFIMRIVRSTRAAVPGRQGGNHHDCQASKAEATNQC